jgi:hypothetical protein
MAAPRNSNTIVRLVDHYALQALAAASSSAAFQEKTMQYYVRRVSLGSAGRLGCLLGWLAVLPPSLVLAWLVVQAAQRVNQALAQIKPLSASVLGQQVLHLDFLQLLQLQALAETVATLAQNPVLTFISIAVFAVLIGGLLCMFTVLIVGLVYNLIARAGWGLALELEPTNRLTTSR